MYIYICIIIIVIIIIIIICNYYDIIINYNANVMIIGGGQVDQHNTPGGGQ